MTIGFIYTNYISIAYACVRLKRYIFFKNVYD